MNDRGNPDDTNADSGEASLDELARRLQFLQLDSADQSRLRRLLPVFRRHADAFVRRFYEHLLEFPETARFLENSELVERLKRMQQVHFESMLAARWDRSYVEQRLQVGDRHAEVGIEPQYFLGSYSAYVQYALDYLAAQQPGTSRELLDALGSLLKAIFLDIGLTLDAYFQRSVANQRQALEMLWKANAELRQFAQLTSHDLKTPLATVANLCDEALDEFRDQMPQEARDLVAAARQRTYRMSAMIDELLAASTLGISEESSETVAGDSLIDEVIERLQPLAVERGVQIHVARPLPGVWGNRARLREVFYNLLSNAVKFVEARSGRVEISGQVEGDRCRIAVSDNGPGIPVEEHARIFAPFRRLPAHRNRPGSGLGLYFTKTLIAQEGGRVWVESTPGEGSRFLVELRRGAT
jgi:signal transduction histidine kinase